METRASPLNRIDRYRITIGDCTIIYLSDCAITEMAEQTTKQWETKTMSEFNFGKSSKQEKPFNFGEKVQDKRNPENNRAPSVLSDAGFAIAKEIKLLLARIEQKQDNFSSVVSNLIELTDKQIKAIAALESTIKTMQVKPVEQEKVKPKITTHYADGTTETRVPKNDDDETKQSNTTVPKQLINCFTDKLSDADKQKVGRALLDIINRSADVDTDIRAYWGKCRKGEGVYSGMFVAPKGVKKLVSVCQQLKQAMSGVPVQENNSGNAQVLSQYAKDFGVSVDALGEMVKAVSTSGYNDDLENAVCDYLDEESNGYDSDDLCKFLVWLESFGNK